MATSAKHGKVKSLTEPTPEQLERHRVRFGSEGLAAETRSADELRKAGLSVREIARTLSVSERMPALGRPAS